MSAPTPLNARRPVSVDVAVVGSGPAGSALSILLADSGINVMMIDETGRPRREFGECLPAAAKPMLTTLGLWSQFLRDGHLPCYGTRSYWGSDEARELDYREESLDCSWHLDRYVFNGMLLARARALGVSVCSPTRITGVERKKDGTWRLALTSPQDQWMSKARFVVDASGTSSSFASRLGVNRRVKDRLVVLSSILEGPMGHRDKDPDTYSTVEAVDSGWWYSALVPENRRIASFITDADLVSKKAPIGKHWLAKLKSSVWTRNHLKSHGYQMGSGPNWRHAGSSRLDQFSGKGWLAVGDAAFACDPLCSQGITGPLLSAFHAKDTITTLFRGNHEALASYAGLMDLTFEDYLALRGSIYTRENRWPKTSFWTRRRKTTPQTADSGLPQLIPYSLG